MPFRFTEQEVAACEASLGVAFPAVYREWVTSCRGIEVEVDGFSWFLFSVAPETDVNSFDAPPSGLQVCDVVGATRVASSLTGWPADAICIGFNGGGGYLFLGKCPDGEWLLGFFGGRYEAGCVRVGPIETAFRSF